MTQAARLTFADVLDDLAHRIPHQAAVIDEVGHHTYAELHAEATAVARTLLALGVRRGEAVSCLIRNRARWLACCMAAAKVGALFVPLNTWYKPGELRWTLRHTEAVVLVAEGSFLGHDWAADLEQIEPAIRTGTPGALRGAELPALRALAGGSAVRALHLRQHWRAQGCCAEAGTASGQCPGDR